MIVSFKNGEKVFTMENADMRSICGGTAEATQSSLAQFMRRMVLCIRNKCQVFKSVLILQGSK